eukprot:g4086.t1
MPDQSGSSAKRGRSEGSSQGGRGGKSNRGRKKGSRGRGRGGKGGKKGNETLKNEGGGGTRKQDNEDDVNRNSKTKSQGERKQTSQSSKSKNAKSDVRKTTKSKNNAMKGDKQDDETRKSVTSSQGKGNNSNNRRDRKPKRGHRHGGVYQPPGQRKKHQERRGGQGGEEQSQPQKNRESQKDRVSHSHHKESSSNHHETSRNYESRASLQVRRREEKARREKARQEHRLEMKRREIRKKRVARWEKSKQKCAHSRDEIALLLSKALTTRKRISRLQEQHDETKVEDSRRDWSKKKLKTDLKKTSALLSKLRQIGHFSKGGVVTSILNVISTSNLTRHVEEIADALGGNMDGSDQNSGSNMGSTSSSSSGVMDASGGALSSSPHNLISNSSNTGSSLISSSSITNPLLSGSNSCGNSGIATESKTISISENVSVFVDIVSAMFVRYEDFIDPLYMAFFQQLNYYEPEAEKGTPVVSLSRRRFILRLVTEMICSGIEYDHSVLLMSLRTLTGAKRVRKENKKNEGGKEIAGEEGKEIVGDDDIDNSDKDADGDEDRESEDETAQNERSKSSGKDNKPTFRVSLTPKTTANLALIVAFCKFYGNRCAGRLPRSLQDHVVKLLRDSEQDIPEDKDVALKMIKDFEEGSRNKNEGQSGGQRTGVDLNNNNPTTTTTTSSSTANPLTIDPLTGDFLWKKKSNSQSYSKKLNQTLDDLSVATFPRQIQDRIFGILKAYVEALFPVLDEKFKSYHKVKAKYDNMIILKGEEFTTSAPIATKLESLSKQFEKLNRSVESLCDSLDLKKPELVKPLLEKNNSQTASSFKVWGGTLTSGMDEATRIKMEEAASRGPWGSEQTRAFYEDIIVLRERVPHILLGIRSDQSASLQQGGGSSSSVTSHSAGDNSGTSGIGGSTNDDTSTNNAAPADIVFRPPTNSNGSRGSIDSALGAFGSGSRNSSTTKTHFDDVNESDPNEGDYFSDDEEEEDEEEEDEEIAPLGGGDIEKKTKPHVKLGEKVEALLGSLPNCLSVSSIDKFAVDFCPINNNGSRKELMERLYRPTSLRVRFATESLPFYARLVATLYNKNPIFKNLGRTLVSKLESEARGLLRRKNPNRLDSKIRCCKFLGELCKFGSKGPCAPAVILRLLNKCTMTDKFRGHACEMGCCLLETCGRYLYSIEEVRPQVLSWCGTAKRLSQINARVDPHAKFLVESALFTVLSLDTNNEMNTKRKRKRKPERRVIHDYIIDLVERHFKQQELYQERERKKRDRQRSSYRAGGNSAQENNEENFGQDKVRKEDVQFVVKQFAILPWLRDDQFSDGETNSSEGDKAEGKSDKEDTRMETKTVGTSSGNDSNTTFPFSTQLDFIDSLIKVCETQTRSRIGRLASLLFHFVSSDIAISVLKPKKLEWVRTFVIELLIDNLIEKIFRGCERCQRRVRQQRVGHIRFLGELAK